jgi:hypothetical protein
LHRQLVPVLRAGSRRAGNKIRNNKMKTAAVISMVAAALGFSGVAAENNQSPPSSPAAQAAPVGGKAAAAMKQAASANQYLDLA